MDDIKIALSSRGQPSPAEQIEAVERTPQAHAHDAALPEDRYTTDLLPGQVELVYKHAPASMFASTTASLVLALALWPVVPRAAVGGWLVYALTVAAGRALLVARYRRAPQVQRDVYRWRRWYLAGVALAGIGWGAVGGLLFPSSSVPHQAFLAAVLVGVTAGAVNALAAMLKSFWAFALLAMGPFLLRLLAEGDLLHVAMGSLGILFVGLMGWFAQSLQSFFLISLNLRSEKRDLIDRLETGKRRADALNVEFAQEVAERKRVEAALREREAAERSAAAVQKAVLDALPARIALLDHHGIILAVNEPWRQAWIAADWEGAGYGVGANYLEVCRTALGEGAEDAWRAAEGIQAVLSGALSKFEVEYARLPPDREGWCRLMVTPVVEERKLGAVVMHIDITKLKRVEEALRESEAQYRHLLDSATDIIYKTDPKGYFIWVNRSASHWTKYSDDELLTMHYLDLVHPDYRKQAERFYGRQFVRKIPSTYYEVPVVAKDGTVIWMGQRVQLLTEQGQAVGFHSVVRDITKQRQAEESLRLSEERTRLIVESALDAVVGMDADGRITDWNTQAETIFGWPRQAVLGKLLSTTIIPQSYREDHDRGCRHFLATGEGPFLNKRIEVVACHQDGHEFPVELSIAPVRVGETYRFNAFVRNITERRQAEEIRNEQTRSAMLTAEVNAALIQSTTIRAILQQCSEALVRHVDAAFARIWLIGPGDLCRDCHKAAFCATREQCLHLEASAGLYTNLNGEYRRVPLGALKIGRIAQGWGAIITNDTLNDDRLPNKQWMREQGLSSFAGYPLQVGDRVIGVMALFARHPLTAWTLQAMESVAKAITLGVERKRAEDELRYRTAQLEAANKELEAFSYTVSHDLRAPLRHIDGFAELLEKHADATLDQKGRRYVKTISESAKQMGVLIDELLTLSRLDKTELRMADVSLDQLVEEILKAFREQQERKIAWTVHSLPTVYGDRVLLRQAIINLVDNAVKYTRPRREAVIEIGSLDQMQAGPDEAGLFIRDNGVGFDMRYAHKLFGVFQRLHTAEEFEGTGVGLATVQRVAGRHGGRVWAEGAPDRGATFYVALPLGRRI